MNAMFARAFDDGHVYRDGIPQSTVNTYRIVYEHGDAP